MKHVYKISLLLSLISMAVVAQNPAETVPEFSFLKLDKSSFTSKDLRSDKKLLFVFFDADCSHCQHAIQYIDTHYQEFSNSAIYLVTLDGQEKINLFFTRYGHGLRQQKNVTILQDPKYDFMNKFKPRKYPSIFLYSERKLLIMYDDDEKSLPAFSKQINAGGK